MSAITNRDDKPGGEGGLPLNSLRMLALLSHVKKLLVVNGFHVTCVPCPPSSQVEELLPLLEVHWPSKSSSESSGKHDDDLDHIKVSALESKYRHARENIIPVCDDAADDPNTKETDQCVTICLKRFLEDNPALRGYDKNINLVEVIRNGHPTDILKEVCILEKEYHQFRKDASDCLPADVTCLHLTSHNKSFIQQQIDLLWRILSPESHIMNQAHLVHGNVITTPHLQHRVTADSFYSQVRQELREAAVMKYGSQVKGEGWERNITCLTQATVKMDLLNSSCKNTIKLSVSQAYNSSAGGPKRCGTFVMYNCARLSTLFSHFNQAVEKGTFPALPRVEDIDFSVLREEEEWLLLFNFIWPYPDVVSEAVSCLASSCHSQTSVDIQTHKVCNFLVSLSQHVSAYYSRCHILGESQPHLYPLMFARLYLMKAVHQVMTNGLNLLDIHPLAQL